MNEESNSTATGSSLPAKVPLDLTGLRKSAAVLALHVFAATTLGTQRCFYREDTAGTRIIELHSESSTEPRKVSPELQARLDAMLDSARREVIEDGMKNAVTDQLPELFLRDFSAIIPALKVFIENGRTPPIVAAELLKELGQIRDFTSHNSRRWLLAWALTTASPFVRDGAALGLARLADPTTLHYLRRAIEMEPNAEIRADFQLVVDELAERVG